MQKRIVVLGGVGFIGTHLCLRLLEAGHELFCVDIRDVGNSPLLRGVVSHPAFHYVHHNIAHPFTIRCDEIYNLTSPSMVRYNKALTVETLKTHLLGSFNALDTARNEKARVLFTSSADADLRMLQLLEGEDTECSQRRYLLGEGKHAAETLHRAYKQEFCVDTRIARIYNTYGSGAEQMDQRVVMKMVVAALQNRDLLVNGSGEQLRTFCWVGDTVEGLIRLMEAPPSATTRMVELGSKQEISIRALAERIIELTGSRSRITHSAPRPGDLRQRIPNLTTAKRELGWEPQTSLVEGLKRTIAYAEKELSNRLYAYSWSEMN